MLLDFLYSILLISVSPLVIYRAARFGRYRRGIRQKCLGLRPDDFRPPLTDLPPKPVAWFHAVSVGEVNLIAGLVAAFRDANPGHRIVISTTTDTGYDLARARFPDDPVFFAPLDFSWAVKQTLDTLRPELLVLAELEIWPNLIRLAHRSGCRVTIANGRLSARSGGRYAKLRRFFAPTFARLDWVGCQDAQTAQRFIECGTRPEAITVTGSIKFDNAPDTRDTPEVHRLARWSATESWHQILLAGSTQPGEEAAALDAYRELSPRHRELRLIIVPRHKERFDEVAELIASRGYVVRRRSQCHAPAEHWSPETVVLVDTIGELRNWWGLCQIAFVGGSFGPRGGQNMLEPAGYGAATCFGPNTQNFAEISSRLLQAGAAIRLAEPSDLTRFVSRCLEDPAESSALGQRAKEVVLSHRGATEKTVNQLSRRVSENVAAIRSAA